jgi:hypothetical protein
MADVEGNIKIEAELPLGDLQKLNDTLLETGALISKLGSATVNSKGLAKGIASLSGNLETLKTSLDGIMKPLDLTSINRVSKSFDTIDASIQRVSKSLKGVKSGGLGGLHDINMVSSSIGRLGKSASSVDRSQLNAYGKLFSEVNLGINDPDGVMMKRYQLDKARYFYQQNKDERYRQERAEYNAKREKEREERDAERAAREATRKKVALAQGGIRAFSSAVGIGTGYQTDVAGAYGKFDIRRPVSSGFDVALGLQGAKNNALTGAGSAMMGGGMGLMAVNPVAGGVLAGGGAVVNMLGQIGKMHTAVFTSALGIMKNISGAIVTVLKGAFDAIKGGLKFVIDLTRSLIGSITKLVAIGGGIALGAGIAAITKSLGQDTNYRLETASGLDLKEQQKMDRMDERFFLKPGSLFTASQGLSEKVANFRTRGIFDNQLPTAMLGMIDDVLGAKDGVQGSYDIATVLSKMLNNAKGDARAENSIRSLAQAAGLDTQLQMADVMANAKYGYRMNGAMFKHVDQEGIEQRKRYAKFSYDPLMKTALPSAIDDIGSTLWNNKLPFIGRTGKDIGATFVNMIAGIAPALRGEGIGKVAGNAGSLLSIIPQAIGGVMKSLGLGGVSDWFKGLKTNVLGAIRGPDKTVFPHEEWQKTYDWKGVWDYIWDGFKRGAENVVGILSDVFDRIEPVIGSLFSKVASMAGKFISEFFSGENGMAKGILGFIDKVTGGIGKMFSGSNGGLMSDIKGFGSLLLVTVYDNLREPIVAITNILWDGVKKIMGFITFIKNPFAEGDKGANYREYGGGSTKSSLGGVTITGRPKLEKYEMGVNYEGTKKSLRQLDPYIKGWVNGIEEFGWRDRYKNIESYKNRVSEISPSFRRAGFKEDASNVLAEYVAYNERHGKEYSNKVESGKAANMLGILKGVDNPVVNTADWFVDSRRADADAYAKKIGFGKYATEGAEPKPPTESDSLSGLAAWFKSNFKAFEDLARNGFKVDTSGKLVIESPDDIKATYTPEVMSSLLGAYATPYTVR